jgi:hypothetical protein
VIVLTTFSQTGQTVKEIMGEIQKSRLETYLIAVMKRAEEVAEKLPKTVLGGEGATSREVEMDLAQEVILRKFITFSSASVAHVTNQFQREHGLFIFSYYYSDLF